MASAVGVGGRCTFTGHMTHLVHKDEPKPAWVNEDHVRMLPKHELDAGIQGKYEQNRSEKIDKYVVPAQGQARLSRTPEEIRKRPKLLRNKDREGRSRRIKPPAGPECRVQSRGAPKENTHSLPSVMRQPRLLHPGCVYKKTDLFRVFRGAEHLESTPSHHSQARRLVCHPESWTRLPPAPFSHFGWICSPTVLYNARIIFLLPMQIMSEPSTFPCLT